MNPEFGLSESALLTDIAMCINYYRLFSPGLYCCVHAPVQIDESTLLRPGIVVMTNHGKHKQCSPDENYHTFHGPPNFVLDVFPGNSHQDYQTRRDAFERTGVIEYVAVQLTEPISWIWNRIADGKFVEIQSGEDEMMRSSALPGLWIPTCAFQQRDWWAVMAAIARGVSRIDHHDFMETIWANSPNRKSSL